MPHMSYQRSRLRATTQRSTESSTGLRRSVPRPGRSVGCRITTASLSVHSLKKVVLLGIVLTSSVDRQVGATDTLRTGTWMIGTTSPFGWATTGGRSNGDVVPIIHVPVLNEIGRAHV